jgi:Flp pilus assembly protein TadG
MKPIIVAGNDPLPRLHLSCRGSTAVARVAGHRQHGTAILDATAEPLDAGHVRQGVLRRVGVDLRARWHRLAQGAGLRSFIADRRGVTAVEFALVAPLMLSVAMGLIELGRFALLTMKVQHASSTLADLASRDQTLSATALSDLFNAARHIMEPFDVASSGRAIVTSFGIPLGQQSARIYWQSSGVGTYAAGSGIGQTGSPTMPADLILREGDTVIAAEMFFHYEPWLLGFVPETTLRRVAYFRPRLGTLTALQ